MTIKNAFRRGFTLIELMIVIVILGILMGTILPRLTGAQSRARDIARIADLNNISQALEVYFSDFGEYPLAVCAGAAKNCLDAKVCNASTDTYTLLKTYLKGDRVPQNVGALTNTLGCIGSYYYTPLVKGGSTQTSYVLASDLETWQMANYLTADGTEQVGVLPDEFDETSESSVYVTKIEKLGTDPSSDSSATVPELRSIYIVIP